ncbi:hypothetical protein ABG827_22150, partial [Phocaeicola vulgatus]
CLMAWEEDSCICLNMQLIAILSRIGVKICVRLLVVQTMAVHGYGGTQVKTTFNSYFSNNYYL